MEKRTPHYKLQRIKQAVAEQRFLFTQAARVGALDLGLATEAQALAVISGMTTRDFYKSMTDYADHTPGKTCTAQRSAASRPISSSSSRPIC